MPYQHKVPPNGDTAAFLREELPRISQAMDAPARSRQWQVNYAVPEKYATGTEVYADGSTWNPGSGPGLYVYDGSAWRSLMSTGESFVVACSDETTALTAGVAKVTFRMPYAFKLTSVKASLTTAQTSGNIFTVDINEGGTTILSTKLTIDNTERTSATAATAAVISDSSIAADAEITIDIDQIGDGTAKGLKVTLIGYRP